MIIYNTTFSVPKKLQEAFIDFIRDEYIPLSIQNNLLVEPRLTRVFPMDENGDTSYALEFKVFTIEALEQWNSTTGKELRLLISSKFGQEIQGFATLLHTVEL